MTSYWNLLFPILALVAVVLLVLILLGRIGPKWLKDLTHRYQRWSLGAAAPIMPIDPDKSPSEWWSKDAINSFPPVKDRIKNSLVELAITWCVAIAIAIIVAAILRVF